jgi:hypothetical protein
MFSIVQSSWLSEEEFGMGHIDLKPATTRSVPGIWKPIKLFFLLKFYDELEHHLSLDLLRKPVSRSLNGKRSKCSCKV